MVLNEVYLTYVKSCYKNIMSGRRKIGVVRNRRKILKSALILAGLKNRRRRRQKGGFRYTVRQGNAAINSAMNKGAALGAVNLAALTGLGIGAKKLWDKVKKKKKKVSFLSF